MKFNFSLTKQCLDTGLTSEAASAYAGYPVHVTYHDQFVGSREIRNFGLSEQDLKKAVAQREKSIEQYLKEKNLFRGEAAEVAARLAMHPFEVQHSTSCFGSVQSSFKVAKNSATKRCAPEILVVSCHGQQRHGIYTNLSPLQPRAKPRIVEVGEEGLLMLSARDETPQGFWARLAVLPEDQIKCDLNPALAKLFVSLHEMRHLIQVDEGGWSDAREYSNEVDAEWFGVSSIKQAAKFGRDPVETIEAIKMSRYTGFLFYQHAHRIAPVIDAYSSNKDAPSYTDVRRASREIVAAVEDVLSLELTDYDVATLDPGELFSAVRRGHKDGLLGPLASSIGERIIEAAEFFSPAISHKPSVTSSIYQQILPS